MNKTSQKPAEHAEKCLAKKYLEVKMRSEMGYA